MAEVAREKTIESLKKLLESGDYSDLILTCGEDEYKVHKAIVCPRSTFFASAIQFSGKEAQEGKINFPEEEPDNMKRMVQYLYEGVYDPQRKTPNASTQHYFPHTCHGNGDPRFQPAAGQFPCFDRKLCPHHDCRNGSCCGYCSNFVCLQCVPDQGAASDLITHAKMYETGDKYGVIGLKELALSNFEWVCESHWDAAEFCVAAHHVFTTTPEDDKGLRDIVRNTILQHRTLIRKPEIEALCMNSRALHTGS